MKRQAGFFFVAILVISWVTQALAAKAPSAPTGGLTVSPYFGNHMVLQRGMPVPVFGTGTPGATVMVVFNGQSESKVVPSSGKWRVDLAAMPATLIGDDLVITSGSTTITFTDVLVGEVWVLSGQSNAWFPLWKCDGGTAAINESGQYPMIRMFQGGSESSPWSVSGPATSPNWSGVGYFFARDLVENMVETVPIGIYQLAVNGTGINQWVVGGRQYNNLIAPLQPMAIRGVLWYQGEDDTGKTSLANAYYQNLPLLINGWRSAWGQGDFPFYIVQLALISGRPNYAIIRDAQVTTAMTVRNTWLACIIDIPTIPATDIHPTNKEPVGHRLALIGRANLYGDTKLGYYGPIRDPASSYVANDSVVVGFKYVDGCFFNTGGADPSPFMVAGSDGVYYPATSVQTAGNTITVSSSSVSKPTSVRYGWDSYPICNLFNEFHLPASPFQIDFR
jgi:sialate O-acetylesterase